jgi:hypothetical protein
VSKNPDGWNEPITRGLWQYETLFGTPRWFVWVHVSLAPFMVIHSFRWLYLAALLQALASAATRAEPEWPQIVHDLINEDGVLET